MKIILKERNCREKASGGRAVLLIIFTILFINISMVFISRLTPLAAGFFSLALILLIMVVAYRVMTGMISEYCYILTDKELLFHRAMGIREIRLVGISYDKIINMGAAGDVGTVKKTYYFLCNKNDSSRKMLTFRKNNKTYTVIFAPSKRFFNALLERGPGLHENRQDGGPR